MADKTKAAALAGAHGHAEVGVEYCPAETRATQRQRLLEHLQQHGSITTDEARRWLGIMHPAGRVRELRHMGWDIRTRRDRHQGRYHLMVHVDQEGGDHA